jgi:23S rRNA pseudouridine2457 synthase
MHHKNTTQSPKKSAGTYSARKTKRVKSERRRTSSTSTPRKLILFNKPFNVMCQFTDQQGRSTLKDYIDIPEVYAAGRLDYDSEGLLVLTNDGKLANQISAPSHKSKQKTPKEYWVQVEGDVSENDLAPLRKGVVLKDGLSLPALAKVIEEPKVWARHPPVRMRKNIPTTWLSLTLTEGRNRQVRRMTAHIGFPTLRLIRYRIGSWTIDGLENGKYSELKIK